MSFRESKECLLAGEYAIEPEEYYANPSKHCRMAKLRARMPTFLLSVFLLASLLCNASMLLHIRTLKASLIPSQSKYGTFSLVLWNTQYLIQPRYVVAGLSDNMPYTYVAKNEWWGDNETRSDELWNGVNTDGVCISLTDTYAREKGLAISGRFPWDNDRGLYFIKGIHDMHCLVMPYFNLEIEHL